MLLCDLLVTYGPDLILSALEISGLYIKRYINSSLHFTLLFTFYFLEQLPKLIVQPIKSCLCVSVC